MENVLVFYIKQSNLTYKFTTKCRLIRQMSSAIYVQPAKMRQPEQYEYASDHL